MATAGSVNDVDTLLAALDALASPTRLHMLQRLRTPRRLHELRAPPTLSRGDERMERPLSRQAVARHLRVLERAGLVVREERAQRAHTFVVDDDRLTRTLAELEALTRRARS